GGSGLIGIDDLRNLVENEAQLGSHIQRVTVAHEKTRHRRRSCLNAEVSDGRLPVRRRWVRWTIGVIAALSVFAVGWVVIRGASAVSELQSVKTSASQMRTAIAESDLTKAERIAPRIAEHAANAHSLTSDFIW